jgi:hypothetical protein
MRHTINKVEDDELYLEIEKANIPDGFYLKIIRQYKNEEPVVSFQAFLMNSDLNNFIIGLQKASLFQKEMYPIEPDSSRNFGSH